MSEHGSLESGTGHRLRRENLWLIDLHVRLGTGPSIEEAESNSKKEVNIARTYLRIHTDDSIDISIQKKDNQVDFQVQILTWSNVLRDGCEETFKTLRQHFKESFNGLRKRDEGRDSDKTHSCPHKRDSPALPNRPLDINDPEDITRFIEINEGRDHYSARSYCWGLSHRITMAAANHAQHRDVIPSARSW